MNRYLQQELMETEGKPYVTINTPRDSDVCFIITTAIFIKRITKAFLFL